MTPSDIIRAWKDPTYRTGLPATERAQLPAHPAGAIELAEPTLHAARHTPGFRIKSGIRGGAGTGIPSQNPTACSAYGDNLWQDDLLQQDDRMIHSQP
jgi:mersacidin/lichenicidin family type 2 lantibiotic